MTPGEIEAALARTLDDHRLSRAEREALLPLFESAAATVGRPEILRRAFHVARAALHDPTDHDVVDWLEGVLRLIDRSAGDARRTTGDTAEAYFSPGDACWSRIVQLLRDARTAVDVCVFTITDDRLAEALLAAHRRGVLVRVITDNAKSDDEGSDVERLGAAGIAVRVDRTDYHMHHKFALFDNALLLTGSYNWTRGASQYNDENFIVTSDGRLILSFARAFETLWSRLAP